MLTNHCLADYALTFTVKSFPPETIIFPELDIDMHRTQSEWAARTCRSGPSVAAINPVGQEGRVSVSSETALTSAWPRNLQLSVRTGGRDKGGEPPAGGGGGGGWHLDVAAMRSSEHEKIQAPSPQ